MNQYRFSLKERSWVLHRRDASKRYLKECSTCNCSYESNVKAGRSGPCCRHEPCLKCRRRVAARWELPPWARGAARDAK